MVTGWEQEFLLLTITRNKHLNSLNSEHSQNQIHHFRIYVLKHCMFVMCDMCWNTYHHQSFLLPMWHKVSTKILQPNSRNVNTKIFSFCQITCNCRAQLAINWYVGSVYWPGFLSPQGSPGEAGSAGLPGEQGPPVSYLSLIFNN